MPVMVSSTVLQPLSARSLPEQMTMVIWLNGSVKKRDRCPMPNASALNPDQSNRRARFSPSGLCPCAIRVSVEALTPENSATCFQFSFLSDFFRSSAFKNAFVLNSVRVMRNSPGLLLRVRYSKSPQWTAPTPSPARPWGHTSASAMPRPQNARRQSRSRMTRKARPPRSRPCSAHSPARSHRRDDGRNCPR
jgi:hypothetical protein